jgi:murein DD-endopeptidase MepM/ murein hydrolase activator NlpD
LICADTYGIWHKLRHLAWYALPWLCCVALLTSCHGGALSARATQRDVYHRVEQGQTLWSIAHAYGVEPKTLARANHLSSTAPLRVGQRLYIPRVKSQRDVSSRCPSCGPVASIPSRNPRQTASASPPKQSAVPQEKAATERPRFVWPVQGAVTRDFEQAGKNRHDGIDIVAPEDTPIRAAAEGKVIYSDWGPGGYGRIVILQHGEDLVTVYAHNHRNLVHAGQLVRQGDQIATVGKSGRATGYHLHFEIRRKTIPIPPVELLSRSRQMAGIESRSGR